MGLWGTKPSHCPLSLGFKQKGLEFECLAGLWFATLFDAGICCSIKRGFLTMVT